MKRSATASTPQLPLAEQTPARPQDLSDGPGTGDQAPFHYRDYAAAKAALEVALRRGVFYALVNGPSGSGKTSLAREISSGLDRHQHQFMYLSAPRVSLLSIVRYFAQVLRLTPRRSSLETIKIIADQLKTQPTHLMVWIDEADGIPTDTLSELRSIAEFHHDVPQVFSVVLSGPAALKALIDTPSLFALKRRISVRCTLEGLRRDELDAFIVHRFAPVAAKRVSLGLRDELFERTRGTPALVDNVVRRALERAGKANITEEHLREALDVAGL
jgi:type II secretory pathway predicted ATPase ExeA